jgi:hypothetical protein
MIEAGRFPLFTPTMMHEGKILPVEPCSSMERDGAQKMPLLWGRVIRTVERAVAIDEEREGIVTALVTHRVTGEMLIKAPYYLSRRKRHCTLSKTFHEVVTQRAMFRRAGTSGQWRLAGMSVGVGGNSAGSFLIERASVEMGNKRQDLEALRMLNLDSFLVNVCRDVARPDVARIALSVQSSEIEPDMVMMRQPWAGEHGRKQLCLTEHLGGNTIYNGEVHLHPTTGMQCIVLEAVQRSSLYDTEAEVVSSYWMFPVVFQEVTTEPCAL